MQAEPQLTRFPVHRGVQIEVYILAGLELRIGAGRRQEVFVVAEWAQFLVAIGTVISAIAALIVAVRSKGKP
jgi:hypothetical protein